jgi:uncharacterized protein
MDDSTPVPSSPSRHKLKLSVDLRFVVIVLVLAIVGMLLAWRPWHTASQPNDDRTISVTGESTLQAEPDQFTFNPTYEFKDASRDTALAKLSAKNTELVAKVKALGVPDSGIKTNASDYNQGGIYYAPQKPGGVDDSTSYTLQLTITLQKRDLAQKVQDYLTTTSPSGAVTPSNNFSDAKRKQLESQARDEATKDARAKADQSAKNLGFKLGKVKSVSDGTGFGMVQPLNKAMSADGATSSPAVAPSISVQPGQNPLDYSVSVEYYLQ